MENTDSSITKDLDLSKNKNNDNKAKDTSFTGHIYRYIKDNLILILIICTLLFIVIYK